MTPRSRCVDPLPAISPFGFEVRLGRCRQADSPGFGAVLFFFSAHFVFFSSSFGGFFFFFLFRFFFWGEGTQREPDSTDRRHLGSRIPSLKVTSCAHSGYISFSGYNKRYIRPTYKPQGRKERERKEERKKEKEPTLSLPPFPVTPLVIRTTPAKGQPNASIPHSVTHAYFSIITRDASGRAGHGPTMTATFPRLSVEFDPSIGGKLGEGGGSFTSNIYRC